MALRASQGQSEAASRPRQLASQLREGLALEDCLVDATPVSSPRVGVASLEQRSSVRRLLQGILPVAVPPTTVVVAPIAK